VAKRFLQTRYFSKEAAKEILDELLPNFYSHGLASSMSMQGFLIHFLPVIVRDYEPPNDTLRQYNYFEWVPTLFSLWSSVANCPAWDILFIDWMARLSEEQLGTVKFSGDQIKFIFTIGLRLMELPIGSGVSGRGGVSSGIRVEVNGVCNVFTKRKKVITNQTIQLYIV
jgi:hypothetical protein